MSLVRKISKPALFVMVFVAVAIIFVASRPAAKVIAGKIVYKVSTYWEQAADDSIVYYLDPANIQHYEKLAYIYEFPSDIQLPVGGASGYQNLVKLYDGERRFGMGFHPFIDKKLLGDDYPSVTNSKNYRAFYHRNGKTYVMFSPMTPVKPDDTRRFSIKYSPNSDPKAFYDLYKYDRKTIDYRLKEKHDQFFEENKYAGVEIVVWQDGVLAFGANGMNLVTAESVFESMQRYTPGISGRNDFEKDIRQMISFLKLGGVVREGNPIFYPSIFHLISVGEGVCGNFQILMERMGSYTPYNIYGLKAGNGKFGHGLNVAYFKGQSYIADLYFTFLAKGEPGDKNVSPDQLSRQILDSVLNDFDVNDSPVATTGLVKCEGKSRAFCIADGIIGDHIFVTSPKKPEAHEAFFNVNEGDRLVIDSRPDWQPHVQHLFRDPKHYGNHLAGRVYWTRSVKAGEITTFETPGPVRHLFTKGQTLLELSLDGKNFLPAKEINDKLKARKRAKFKVYARTSNSTDLVAAVQINPYLLLLKANGILEKNANKSGTYSPVVQQVRKGQEHISVYFEDGPSPAVHPLTAIELDELANENFKLSRVER